jgi:hypothetical protein
MNKFTLIAGLLLAATAATTQAAGIIGSLALVPSVAQTLNFENENGLIVNGGSYAFGSGSLSSTLQYTVGQNNADLGENGLWGGNGNHFLSFDNVGDMTLNVIFAQATSGFAFDFSAWQELGSMTPAEVSISYYDAANSLIGAHTEAINSSLGLNSYNSYLTTGYLSDSANIVRVSITGDGVVLDNLTYSVPEPGTPALIGLALGVMGLMSRRRRTV